MQFCDTLRLALAAHKLRTALTLLGLVLGGTSLILVDDASNLYEGSLLC